MNFIILDLEATCWQGNAMDRNQEIIELGAYRVDAKGTWIDSFQAFVKPVENPRLSTYCIDLTGITQQEIDKSKTFNHIFPLFEDWYFAEDDQQLLCTWGAKDIDYIQADCLRHDVDFSFLPPCIDLKEQYSTMYRLSKEVSLAKALEFQEIIFEGSPHRAIDDAFNTTKLFLRLLHRWQF